MKEGCPFQHLADMDVVHLHLGRKMVGMAQHPETDVVFHAQENWPKGCEYIMQRNCDHRGDRIAAKEIRHAKRKQRLDPEERREPDEHADGNPSGNRMRSIP